MRAHPHRRSLRFRLPTPLNSASRSLLYPQEESNFLSVTDGARDWLAKALTTIESQRSSLKDYSQRRTLLNNKYQAYQLGVKMALKQNDNAQAFAFSERCRARTFLDALGTKGGPSRAAPTASLADLQAASDSFATVTFWFRSQGLLAWIVCKNSVERVTIPLARETSQRQLAAFYRRLVSRQDTVTWLPWMKALWTQLWAPIEEKLKPDERVCIIPHHMLHYVPFQALHDGKQFLVQRHSVFYAPSGSGLVQLRKRSRVPASPIAIFDAALENDPTSPFSKTPTDMLCKRYPKAHVFVREKSTEEAFRNAGRTGLVHVTAHGSYNAWIPLRSGLHLHAAGKDDGVLRAEEISRLDANATALVVLCSCVSSVGELTNGDEATGVTRAFQTAGARNVIGSLWPVKVTATNRLMDLFYEQLQSNADDPVQALCEAQRHFLKQDPYPYLWAAFQVNGSGDR